MFANECNNVNKIESDKSKSRKLKTKQSIFCQLKFIQFNSYKAF